MNVGIVVDNLPAARLVRRVLDDPRVEVFDAEERSAAIMGIGSLAAQGLAGVLLLDSDTLEDRALTELQLEVGALVRMGNAACPRRLVLAIPQVESILFSDRVGLENALGKKIADDDFFEARFRPKAVFYRLLGGKKPQERALAVIDAIDETSLRRMAAHPVIREIQEFVEEVQRPRTAKVRRAS